MIKLPNYLRRAPLCHYIDKRVMRAPRKNRPRKRQIRVQDDCLLDDLAERVWYEGSAEHKDVLSFRGLPELRSDASICPRHISSREQVTEWLRTAIRTGAVGPPWEGDYPRYVWYMTDGTVYEARLTNRGSGAYKGYPLEEAEWPRGIQDLYAGN